MIFSISANNTNDHGTGYHYFERVLPLIFLFVVLFFSAWVRFYGITEQGISGGDAFRYVYEAKRWVEGRTSYFAGGFYRPVSYFLQAAAIRILGYNDYSIKLLHVSMDMINILLVFLIAARAAKNLWVGTISSLLYAFLPNVIYLARSELVHVESTAFVLLSLFFFILFDDRKRENKGFKSYFLLFLSGLSLGLAANTHNDLAFLAPAYMSYLFIKSWGSQNKKDSLKEFSILAFIFSFSFFTPYLLGFLIFGPQKVINMMLKEGSKVKWNMDNIYGSISKLQLVSTILKSFIKFYFGKRLFFISMLLIGAIFIMIYRKIKRISDPLWAYFPLISIFSYVFIYSCFFSSAIEVGRYFMPLFPLVIFISTIWYHKIVKQLFGKYSSVVFICLFLILFLINPKEIIGKRTFRSPYREVYDILKDHVNKKNRLLIAPVTLFWEDFGYRNNLYFRKNAVYLCQLPLNEEYNLKSLKKLLKGMNIRYIFIGTRIDRRLFDPDCPVWQKAKNWSRNARSSYSLEKELQIIEAYLQHKGGMVINKSNHGKIYYLTGEKYAGGKTGLITNGSFEYWWKGFPMGEWERVSGQVSMSGESTHGLKSMCMKPNAREETRVIWIFDNQQDPFKKRAKLRVQIDAKAGKTGELDFFFNAYINGKWKALKPFGGYPCKGEWVTIAKDFIITHDTKRLIFNLRLLPGAGEPAFVDNLSIDCQVISE